MTHIDDTGENKHVNMNPIEFSVTSKNNSTSTMLELDKSKVILRSK